MLTAIHFFFGLSWAACWSLLSRRSIQRRLQACGVSCKRSSYAFQVTTSKFLSTTTTLGKESSLSFSLTPISFSSLHGRANQFLSSHSSRINRSNSSNERSSERKMGSLAGKKS